MDEDISTVELRRALEAKLREKHQELIDQIRCIQEQLDDMDRRIQLVCVHRWVWAPIAGEGRVCTRCGLRDFSDD